MPTAPNQAPLVNRIASDVVDYIVVAAACTAVVFSLVQGSVADEIGAAAAAFGVVYAVYEIVGVARWGKTLGRHLAGVVVLQADGVALLGFRRSIIRWFIKTLQPFLWGSRSMATAQQIANMLVLVSIFVNAGVSGERRGLHDLAAGSNVWSHRRPGANEG